MNLPKTTTAQTLLYPSDQLNLNNPNKSIVYDPNDRPHQTIKESNPSINPNRHFSSLQTKSITYDPNNRPAITTKESVLHDKIKTNQFINKGNGYQCSKVIAPATTRQFTSNHLYVGTSKSTITPGGYKNQNVIAKPTIKQHTGKSSYSAPKQAICPLKPNRENINNMQINSSKERIVQSQQKHYPTNSNVPIAIGAESLGSFTKDKIQNTVELINKHQKPINSLPPIGALYHETNLNRATVTEYNHNRNNPELQIKNDLTIHINN
jgi:hypothetical protein